MAESDARFGDARTDVAAASIDRVVVVHDYATPEGGAGVLAIKCAQEYRKLGLPVTYFAGGEGDVPANLPGIDVVSLQSKGLLKLSRLEAMRQGLNNRRARQMLSEWIARHDTPRTVYHLHNWSQILSPAIFEALRPVERRTVVTCHDFFNVCPNGSFTHFGKSEACELKPLSPACLLSQCDRRNSLHKYWRAARHIYLQRMAAFATSQFTFTFIHDRMRERFVRSGFPATGLVTIPNPAEPWTAARIPAERNRRFLFVGRLGRDKGADLAIDAAAKAQVPITMIGTGELQTELAGKPADAQFAGWCDGHEIARHATEARALIVPSRVVEPFGLVILEAAMSGLPVIVSDRAYLAHDAEAYGFGRRFHLSNPSELPDLLETIARDGSLVEEMSRRGFRTAHALCNTPQTWAAQFIEIFCSKIGFERADGLCQA